MQSHFAVFPTEIPRRAILAGTSARGCCPKCFAPWERVVERKTNVETMPRSDRSAYEENVTRYGKTSALRVSGSQNYEAETRTVGWEPGCSCNWSVTTNGKTIAQEHKPIPCTVLDPFGGSGTVGQVATELGRQSILCELNDAYLPLINNRTNVTPGLALH